MTNKTTSSKIKRKNTLLIIFLVFAMILSFGAQTLLIKKFIVDNAITFLSRSSQVSSSIERKAENKGISSMLVHLDNAVSLPNNLNDNGNYTYLSATTSHKHSWSNWQHNSDIHWKICKTCGKYKQADTHTLQEYKRVNATCYNNGYVLYKCKCGYKCKKILKSSKAHEYDSGKVTLYPTCCKKGQKVYTCKLCGKTRKVALAPNDNHSYDNGVITISPTCYSSGIKKYTCTSCGKTKTETILPNNAHSAKYWDCNENGHWLNCDKCGVKYNSSSHSFDSGVITSDYLSSYVIMYTCTTCGYQKYESKTRACTHTATYWDCNENGHWLNCDKCHAKYNSSSHNFNSGVITSSNEKSYTMKYTCNTCGYSKEITYQKEQPNTLGNVDIVLGSSNFSLGDVITFSLKYSGVDSLKDLKIYIDDVEATSKVISLVYIGDHFMTYNIDTSSFKRGSIRLNIVTSNCYAVSTYINIK